MVRSIVFGAWGEGSSDVDWLVTQIADFATARPARVRADCDDEDARASLIAALQRRWGLVAVRANAQLLLDRLAYVGRGAMAAAERRSAANADRCTRQHIRAWTGTRGRRRGSMR